MMYFHQGKTGTFSAVSSYYNKFQEVVVAFMPLAVYGILMHGYKMLSTIAGLEDLDKTAMEETEVRAIIEK